MFSNFNIKWYWNYSCIHVWFTWYKIQKQWSWIQWLCRQPTTFTFIGNYSFVFNVWYHIHGHTFLRNNSNRLARRPRLEAQNATNAKFWHWIGLFIQRFCDWIWSDLFLERAFCKCIFWVHDRNIFHSRVFVIVSFCKGKKRRGNSQLTNPLYLNYKPKTQLQ